MKILALEKEVPGRGARDFRPYLEDEAKKVWELHQEGIIREMYFRADVSEAVLVLECATLEEAQGTLEGMPLAEAGLINFDLIPLRPYDGLKRLFADQP